LTHGATAILPDDGFFPAIPTSILAFLAVLNRGLLAMPLGIFVAAVVKVGKAEGHASGLMSTAQFTFALVVDPHFRIFAWKNVFLLFWIVPIAIALHLVLYWPFRGLREFVHHRRLRFSEGQEPVQEGQQTE
jgi:hypothetical protein